MTGVRVTRLPKRTAVIQQRFLWAIGWHQLGILCYLLIYTHHSPGPQVRVSGDRQPLSIITTAAGVRTVCPASPHLPQNCPPKNDQLPELLLGEIEKSARQTVT